MKAELVVPPLFEVKPFMNEGTGEPFMARLFLAPPDMQQSIMAPDTKSQFDECWSGCIYPALEMRKAMLAIKELVENHKKAPQKKSIVRKEGNQLLLTERIDNPLRSQVAQLLEMASHVLDHIPGVMKFLGVEMSFYADKESRFFKEFEKAQKERPELADYLLREELVMYALQGQCKGSLMIDEIPLGSRAQQNPQRFKRNLKGMGAAWELKWSSTGFYES